MCVQEASRKVSVSKGVSMKVECVDESAQGGRVYAGKCIRRGTVSRRVFRKEECVQECVQEGET